MITVNELRSKIRLLLPLNECLLSDVFELNDTLADVQLGRLNTLWSEIRQKIAIFDYDFSYGVDLEPISKALDNVLDLKNQGISNSNFSVSEAFFEILILILKIDKLVYTNQPSKEVVPFKKLLKNIFFYNYS